MRARIIMLVRERPSNTNQIAVALDIDYKTAAHHLRVLRENRVLSPTGDGYGAVFLLTPEMEESLPAFDDIISHLEVP